MDGIVEIVPVRAMSSPCVNICQIDEATGWCIGCRRTIDEIACWTAGSDTWRDQVIAALPTRVAER